MYLIKICPSCKLKLRFPIDKGTIKVSCSCGHSFIANPDSTDIYQEAVFDLSHTTCGLKKMVPLQRWIDKIQFSRIIPAMITGALNIKYKLQNFRLLPDTEKKRIILAILFIGVGIIGLIVTIYLLRQI